MSSLAGTGNRCSSVARLESYVVEQTLDIYPFVTVLEVIMKQASLILLVVVLGCGKTSPSESTSPPEHGLAKGDNVILLKDSTLAHDSVADTVLAKGTKLTVSRVDGDRIWTNVLSPVVLEGHRGRAKAAEFSPDGKFVVSGGGTIGQFGEAMLWDTESGEKFRDLAI